MAGSTTKKVLIRRFDGQTVPGFAAPHSYLRPEGIEVLTRDGELLVVPYKELKTVNFVREFETPDGAEEKKLFQSRPKLEGLWVRFRFRDDDLLDGILPNDLLLVTELGVTVTPPDPYSNNQKIFIPRLAVREMTVLGVIGSPIHRARAKRRPPAKEQIELFEK
jgi:hypothetical protein